MADLSTVRAKLQLAVNEADAALATPPPVGELQPADWATRSAGRVMARRLRDPGPAGANIDGRWPSPAGGIWQSDPAYQQPVVDARGVRHDIVPGKGINDVYYPFGKEFGADSFFALQFKYHCNQVFRDTIFKMVGGAPPGIKLAIICTTQASSDWEKLVVSTRDQHKFPYLYRYDQNGLTDPMEIPYPGGLDYQPRLGEAPTCTREAWITANDNGNGWGSIVPGCETIVGEKDIYFDLEATTGSLIPGTNTWDCEMKLWMTIDGVRKLVEHYGPGIAGYRGRNAKPWTAVWLSPYMTNRDGTQTFPLGVPSVWYDDLIVDDKRINPALADAVQMPQTIDIFEASRTTVTAGESATLSWQTTAASRVTLDGADVTEDGSQDVTPTADRSYVLEAEGSAAKISRSISISVAPVVTPTPGVPSFVPPPGQFAEFTLNKPNDLLVPGTSTPQFYYAILANWCGGAFIRDYSASGGVAYWGGGEHSLINDQGGALVLNCETRMYEARCVPLIQSHMQVVAVGQGSLTDVWGSYADDGYQQHKHTYNSLSEMPAAWGGGSRGSLVHVGQAGGILNPSDPEWPTHTHGKSCGFRYDLSQAQNGHTRFTGENTFNFGNNTAAAVNDAASCGMDWLREGWWVYPRTGSGWGDRLCFVHKDGAIDGAATPAIGLQWGTIHHFADNDTLCVLANGVHLHQPGSASWTSLPISRFTGEATAVAAWNVQWGFLGYVGFKWSTILGAFVGLDHGSDSNIAGFNTVRVWKVTPPPMATRSTGNWTVELITLTSADGSQINVRTDHASMNGTWGKLVEAPALRAFVHTRRIDARGMLLRLPGM